MAADLGAASAFGVGVDGDGVEDHPQRLLGLALGQQEFPRGSPSCTPASGGAAAHPVDVIVVDAQQELTSVQPERVAVVLQGDGQASGRVRRLAGRRGVGVEAP